MSRSLRTDPRPRQALRRAGELDRVRIHVHAARPGFAHPASGRDVRAVLDAVGAWAWYGLRVVELRQTEDYNPGYVLYGQMRAPGEMRLYEQPAHQAGQLRDFMLFDVLLHRARKIRRIERTSDHERFAEAFAATWEPVARAALA